MSYVVAFLNHTPIFIRARFYVLESAFQHDQLQDPHIMCYNSIHVIVYGVPKPVHVSKSQHGGKLPTSYPQEMINNLYIYIGYLSLSRILIIYAKVFAKLVLSVGSNILLNPTLNTSPKPHLRKVSPCRFPCCTSYLIRTWDPCEEVCPNLYACNGWDYMDWPQVTYRTHVNQP